MTVFYCFYCLFRYLYPKPFKFFSLYPTLLLIFVHFFQAIFLPGECVERGNQKKITIPPSPGYPSPDLTLFQCNFFFLNILLASPYFLFMSLETEVASKSLIQYCTVHEVDPTPTQPTPPLPHSPLLKREKEREKDRKDRKRKEKKNV